MLCVAPHHQKDDDPGANGQSVQTHARLTAPPVRAGSYRTILADPPWLERGGGRIKRGADRHYPLLTTFEICTLPVEEWAAPDAHLYLWVTNNFLIDGLNVMTDWGFRYVTCLTWLKDRMGLGQYFRGNTEHCLFGVRGKAPYRFNEHGKRAQGVTGFQAPRGQHSVKPEQVRRYAELVSYGPYLEMFARRSAPGWDCWGNEAPSPAAREAQAVDASSLVSDGESQK